MQPDKPFFMYWATGCLHGPHHIMKEWADKYRGKFDDGWDVYRQRALEGAKAKGWVPAGAVLTPRPETLAAWDSIPDDQKPFQARLMEVPRATPSMRMSRPGGSSMRSSSSATARTR
jgi:arylsulfatase A-like enzyme